MYGWKLITQRALNHFYIYNWGSLWQWYKLKYVNIEKGFSFQFICGNLKVLFFLWEKLNFNCEMVYQYFVQDKTCTNLNKRICNILIYRFIQYSAGMFLKFRLYCRDRARIRKRTSCFFDAYIYIYIVYTGIRAFKEFEIWYAFYLCSHKPRQLELLSIFIIYLWTWSKIRQRSRHFNICLTFSELINRQDISSDMQTGLSKQLIV